MNWFRNMKVKSKLLLGFSIATILALVLATVGILTSTTIDKDYSYILEYPQKRMDDLSNVTLHVARTRRIAITMGVYAGDSAKLDELKASLDAEVANVEAAIDAFIENLNSDYRITEEERQAELLEIESIRGVLQTYKTEIADKIYDAAKKKNTALVQSTIDQGTGIITGLINDSDALWQTASEFVDDLSANCTEDSNRSVKILFAVTILTALLLMTIAIVIARIISNPIKKLVEITDDVARGQLNVNSIPETKDEIGMLVKNFFVVINVVKSLVDDLSEMGHDHTAGEIDSKVDESKYEGSYRDVVIETNKMVGDHVDLILLFMSKMSDLVGGDFNVALEQQPGKKAIMNENLENLRTAIKGISNEIGGVIKNISEGQTKERIDVKHYDGDWAILMSGLNQVLQSYSDPIDEMLSVLQQIAKGNFRESMKGTYKGDFNLIKSSVNDMAANTSAYISEISSVLGAMANDDLDQIITREYVGEFSDIKDALNDIITKFNNVITDIYNAADQVADGAKQISQSSMTLAEGASEQASSIQELNATITTINENTLKNAENAKEAENLAAASKHNAEKGNQDMSGMLVSMEGINDSSNNIAKIIKVIDDIAFQTNLLALNAAVEAARAGEHGKGFAVVAEEVRNLAGRSQNAAKETAALIEESIGKVNEGTKIAGTTAKALNTIMSDAAGVSDIITNIAGASSEQAEAINQVTIGLSQITEVVQSNSATSEESASASEELSSQAEVLRNLVSVFKLRR